MKKQLQTLALSLTFSALPASAAVVSTYAIDFHGTVQPDTLAPTQVAGVVPTTGGMQPLVSREEDHLSLTRVLAAASLMVGMLLLMARSLAAHLPLVTKT
ncbi:MAG: hypothetical protein ACSHYB_16245 [Roseibacillus sp.]